MAGTRDRERERKREREREREREKEREREREREREKEIARFLTFYTQRPLPRRPLEALHERFPHRAQQLLVHLKLMQISPRSNYKIQSSNYNFFPHL